MKHYETIKTEDTQGFHIVFSVGYEDTHPRDLFDTTCEDIDDLCRKIDSGELVYFIARIEAYKHGILLGSDYLGGCVYNTYQEFIDGDYYQDMVDQAIEDAKQNLEKLSIPA